MRAWSRVATSGGGTATLAARAARNEGTTKGSVGDWRHRWGPTAIAAAISVLALFAVVRLVYGDFHPVVDQVVYRAQAEALRDGSLTLPLDPDGGTLVFTAVRGDTAVAKYLPGTAAIGAASLVVTGSSGLATAAALVLLVVAVGGLGSAAGLSPRARALAALAVGLSPTVLALDARLLSYVPSLALATAAAWAVVASVRRPGWWPALVGGLLLGAALWFRQLEVVAWGAVLVVWLAWASGRARVAAARIAALVIGVVPSLIGIVLYDRAVTGGALTLPFAFVSPDDTPGFGLRRALPSDPYVPFTLVGGLRAAVSGLWTLLPWTAVGLALGVGAVVALRRGVRTRVTPLLVGLALVVPVAFVLQWSHKNALRGGHYDGVGPFYLVYVLPPLAVLGVAGLRTVRDRRVVAGVLVAAVAVQGLLLWAPLGRQLELQRDWAGFDREVEALGDAGLVLVDAPYLGQPFERLVPGLAPPGLVVTPAPTPAATFAALDRWPARRPVLAVTDLASVRGRQVPVPAVVPLVAPGAEGTLEGGFAVGCGPLATGSEVDVLVGDAGAPVACGSTGVRMALRPGRLELDAGDRHLFGVDIPQGASSIDVCVRLPGGGAQETACRHVPVLVAGDRVRWVLPGRTDPDAAVRGLADLVGPALAAATPPAALASSGP